jgi:hypothetical protein
MLVSQADADTLTLSTPNSLLPGWPKTCLAVDGTRSGYRRAFEVE